MQKNLQTRFSTRQYMLSRDFELYYYNEHYTSKVDTHTHDYYEFYFFMEGDVSIEIEGQRYPLRYGDMVVIPPHRSRCAQPCAGIPSVRVLGQPGICRPADGALAGIRLSDAARGSVREKCVSQ